LVDFPVTASVGFFHYSSALLPDFSLARFNNISLYTPVGTITGTATSGTSILPVDIGTGNGNTQTGSQPYVITGTGVGPYSQAFTTASSGTLTVSFPTTKSIFTRTTSTSIASSGTFTYGDVMRDFMVTQMGWVSSTNTQPSGSFSFSISGLTPNTAYNLRIWSHYKGNDNNTPYNWWSWNGGQAGLIGTVTNLSNPTYTDNNQFSVANTVYSNDYGTLILYLTTLSPSAGALNAFELKSANLVNLAAATGDSPASVALTWNAAPAATSYLVERSSSPTSGFVQIGTSSSNSYTDFEGTPGQLNYYRVKGTNPFFQSSYTSVASAIPATSDPAIHLSGSSISVNEGGTNTFGVRLNSAPVSDVVVSIARTAGSTNLSIVGGSTLTFTPANYAAYQNLTIASAEDDADAVNDTATFTATSANYGNGPVSVNVTQMDNDVQAAGDLTGTPAALIGTNIGANSTGSSSVRADGRWWIDGSGTGISGTADSFHLESKTVTGNFRVVAKIESVTSTGATPRGGLMIRESTAAGARFVSLAAASASSGGYKVQSRTTTNGAASAETTTNGPGLTYIEPNAWVLFKRTGDQVVIAVSPDGISYRQISTMTLSSLTASVEVGVFSSSGMVGTSARCVVSSFSIIPDPVPTGTNIAPSATLSVDSTYSTNSASYAVDGIKTAASRWLSANTNVPHWFEMDWPSAQTINNVKVWSGATAAGYELRSYTVQYWDGASWQIAATVTDNTKDMAAGQFNDLTFPTVITTKLKLNITQGSWVSNDYYARLAEVEVRNNNSGMENWRQANFGTTTITSGVNGDRDTPNGDGVTTLMAYALGLSPTHANSPLSLPLFQRETIQTDSGTDQYLTCTFTYNMTASDVQIYVEVASDLNGPWTQIDPFAAANQLSVSFDYPQSGIETILVQDIQPTSASTKRFMRLKVTHP
jgi:hypothetical protein